MAESEDLLIEIGTEELPPTELARLASAFRDEFAKALQSAGLGNEGVRWYATPRRLTLYVEALATSQPARESERRGPAVSNAFDADGNPTKAAQGFARSCGVEVDALEQLESDKGAYLVFRASEPAKPTGPLIPDMVGTALGKLPIARRMRWGQSDIEFVRPIHWVVLLLGEDVIDAEVYGIQTGRETRGHRFHAPGPLYLKHPSQYRDRLRDVGRVIVDFDERRDLIVEQIKASDVGGHPVLDDNLLDEVTAMVEWPTVVTGHFDDEFLKLPPKVLIASMQGHQRYFPVTKNAESEELEATFITVSNITSRDPDAVRAGNQRVIRPRLQDAKFFFEGDLKTPLADRLEQLRGMIFHRKLGSLADKSERVSALARHVAIAIGQSPDEVNLADRAGLLSKCDLTSEMVGEFPELQGYMGGQYASRGGEPAAVCEAIAESYMPRFAGDALPSAGTATAVAMADKLDTLAGVFGVGQAPTGDKDPYALRRAALGVLRMIIEGELDVDLRPLVAAAVGEYGEQFDRDKVTDEVVAFMMERLRPYFMEREVPAEVFAAVQARHPTKPHDFARRVQAVDAFRQRPEAASLAAANKRIQNILRQVDTQGPPQVDESLLKEDAEWNLAAKLIGIGPRVSQLLKGGEYAEALTHLAGLRDTIDEFFDTVMVMDEDAQLRGNRLAVLRNLGALFSETADISLLHG